MEKLIYEDKTIDNMDYCGQALPAAEYENCHFFNCNFSNADISNNDFMECTFKRCNLSLATVTKTGIKNVAFIDCKLSGVQFANCSSFLFEASFENCLLDYSSFYQKKMKKANFNNCSLKEVDFVETDLTMATFNNCEMANAIFERTILEKADFRTARNYCLDPELNRLKKAKFSFPEIAGLLTKYQIEID